MTRAGTLILATKSLKIARFPAGFEVPEKSVRDDVRITPLMPVRAPAALTADTEPLLVPTIQTGLPQRAVAALMKPCKLLSCEPFCNRWPSPMPVVQKPGQPSAIMTLRPYPGRDRPSGSGSCPCFPLSCPPRFADRP